MSEWSLEQLLTGLHDDIESRLAIARRSFQHSGTKGDASEGVWLELLNKYLPRRYQAAKAHVVDSNGVFSDQIDVVVYDHQYSPFIFRYENQEIIPAESVYAVFETKQTINAENVKYAMEKAASVRKLHRTSLPIPHAGGTYPAKPPIKIYAGLLTLESEWSPPLGDALTSALKDRNSDNELNLGCIAAHGYFDIDNESGEYLLYPGSRPATAFLFALISRLQFSGTVPMIDILAYAKWISP